jgi:hypothetical protein
VRSEHDVSEESYLPFSGLKNKSKFQQEVYGKQRGIDRGLLCLIFIPVDGGDTKLRNVGLSPNCNPEDNTLHDVKSFKFIN